MSAATRSSVASPKDSARCGTATTHPKCTAGGLRPDVTKALTAAGEKHRVPAWAVHVVAQNESGGNLETPDSTMVGIGLMQPMPKKARDLGVDPRNVGQNVDGGARYLRDLMARYRVNLPLVFAPYDDGSEAVEKASI
jgi:soluble lytic murein transglycosylase-like protein